MNIRLSESEKTKLDMQARRRGFRGAADYLRATALAGQLPQEYAFTVVIHPGEADEDGYWAEVPALQGCNAEGKTFQETVENAREAIRGYIEMLRKRNRPIPEEAQPASQPITAAVKVVA